MIEESVSTVADDAIAPAMICALHLKALDARVDQAGAELREKDDADRERDQAGEVENDDAPGEARRALRDEKLPGAPQPVADAGETVRRAAPRRARRRMAPHLGMGSSAEPSASAALLHLRASGRALHVLRFDRARRLPGFRSCPLHAGMDNAITTARQPPSQGPWFSGPKDPTACLFERAFLRVNAQRAYSLKR